MGKNVIALAAILRKYTKDQWITTNCMASYMQVDPWRSDFLDYIS